MFNFRKISRNIKQISTILWLLIVISVSAFAQKTKPIDYSQKIIAATPNQLPQTPVANRQTTDAQDDNLKGKVKSVVEEREGLTGVEKPIGRRTALFADYDEQGNYLREVTFDYRGKPYNVRVYGYIDGARASISKSISYSDEDRLTVSGIRNKTEMKNKPDTRYGYKYEYKYENGKLIEMQLINNTGEKSNRLVYNNRENHREESVYINENELNRKYLYTFDKEGNEVERIDFDVRQKVPVESAKYRFKYENFDKQGNWTKRRFLQVITKNGKDIEELIAIEYRSITYYP